MAKRLYLSLETTGALCFHRRQSYPPSPRHVFGCYYWGLLQAKDPAKHLAVHKAAPHNRIIQPTCPYEMTGFKNRACKQGVVLAVKDSTRCQEWKWDQLRERALA